MSGICSKTMPTVFQNFTVHTALNPAFIPQLPKGFYCNASNDLICVANSLQFVY